MIGGEEAVHCTWFLKSIRTTSPPCSEESLANTAETTYLQRRVGQSADIANAMPRRSCAINREFVLEKGAPTLAVLRNGGVDAVSFLGLRSCFGFGACKKKNNTKEN